MHVLGHSFSQRRKTKPRDLHIRKVSFSGSSLSSGCSFSSTSSTSTAREHTPRVPSSTTTASFDPLALHPTFQAPPRLYDRPLIPTDRERYDEVPALYDSEDADGESSDLDASEKDMDEVQHFHMELPPHASPMDHADHGEPQDYFFMQHIAKRPPMPRSRWSESTIQTLDQLTPVTSVSNPATSCAIADADEDADAAAAGIDSSYSVPNFSYKRNTVLKRPTFKPMDSFEEFIKRGGWKRRGIVFHNEDMVDYEMR